MTAKDEREAAYFTLLRARDEHTDLLRYQEYLGIEIARLDEFTATTGDAADQVARRVRRPVDATQKPLFEAVGRRRAVVLDELRRVEDRIAAAQRFVEECEAEVASLR